MSIIKRRRGLAAVIGIALALLFVGGGTAIAAQTSRAGTTVYRATVLSEDNATTWDQTTFTTVASTSIFATASSIIVVDFSAESACYNGSGWCSARILVDGVEAAPVVGTDFAFDSNDGGTETASSWESHAMQRSFTVSTSATHSITLQVATVGGTTLRLDDWSLSALSIAP